MAHKLGVSFITLVFVFSTGCNSGTVRLHGQVTVDGEPVNNGTIQFVPADLMKGPTTGARIADGKYDVPAPKGALPGVAYKVEITAMRKTGKTIANIFDPKGPPMEVEEQFVPERFNKATTLNIEVKGGENRFDFALESK